jgi:hypothetical protein
MERLQSTQGARRAYFYPGRATFHPQLDSSRGEIHAQPVVRMLLLDQASDAIIQAREHPSS